MIIKKLALAVFATLALLHFPVYSATRLGGADDDSICDVGDVGQRSVKWPVAWEFINSQCKNGQLLIGRSIESSMGGFEIEGLARAFCRAADIQLRITQGSLVGIPTQYGHVRCKIEKLKAGTANKGL